MKAALPGFALLAALLVVPFALRPTPEAEPDTSRRLVVLTPHNEAIRFEMGRGFQRYLQKRGQAPVRMDWRSPGGTTEISRYLGSEYRSAFGHYFAKKRGYALSERAALAFANPKQDPSGKDDAALARKAFLDSSVGVGIDVLFGGGSYDFAQHAAAGRLVDAGMLQRHPELFGQSGSIPQTVGGEPYWDKQGRWVGACVSGFGICFNRDALAALGVTRTPTRWSDLADPRLAGHVAVADPSKSGSANKAYEMILQQAMGEAWQAAGSPPAGSAQEASTIERGFEAGLRLIRHIGGVSRYFSDQSDKISQDVQSGSAAVGMCIDFYGRFANDVPGPGQRLQFVIPEGGSSMGSDPIGLLRGAPSAELARTFMDFVLSEEGQALWAYKRGTPGGPLRYALRRTPILPALFAPERRALLSDPEANPYETARAFSYHAAWTAPLFRALSFVIRVMCVDTEDELHQASADLERYGQPARARALFDDMTLVSYLVVKDEIAPELGSLDPLREVALQNRLVTALKAQYERVSELARSGP